ncbi:zf-TFIIB domain-containing protein [Myxococcus fulvus]|uniref:TFIIB-type zinc ribbon-containing protein n=1 Tax=Myxococcus fulvus TaxID=33 RepID=UPI0020C08EBE|nr:zf-TFIIB domain-containing protein [Myxococcus fulvus]MCK8503659.1 zf-TFIIB domain-containing protein [Myxococcus fulvus]
MERSCPVCPPPAPPLRVIDLRGVPVDTCARCQGHWLDAGELERLAPGWRTEALQAALPSATRRCRHARHHVPAMREECGLCGSPVARCPSCDETLSQVRTEVCAVDVCSRCHGLWLDANELKQLMDWHRRWKRPLVVGLTAAGTTAAAAVALSQVAGDTPTRTRVTEVLQSTMEQAAESVDVVELAVGAVDLAGSAAEGVGTAVEAAVEGGEVVSAAVGGLLAVVAGLFQ